MGDVTSAVGGLPSGAGVDAGTVADEAGRERPLVHVPLSLVHLTLVALRRVFGEAVFATWEEAELMEVPMTTPRGTADVERLGVTPLGVREVLARE